MRFVGSLTILQMPLDKAAHALVGLCIVLGAGYLLAPLYCLALAVAVGAAKEAYDKCHPDHTVDAFDFLATAGGGVIGTAFVWVLK